MTLPSDKPAPESAQPQAGGGDVIAFPASIAQQVFWYLEMLQPGVTAFNVSMRFRLDGPLDIGRLECTINTIVARHESLRTHFEEEDGELLQVVFPQLAIPLPVLDISHLAADKVQAEADRLSEIEAQRPFRLAIGPMIRTELVRLAPASHILHVTVHHAMFDGWSMTILTEEIARIYQAYADGLPCPLEPLPIQYGDFSIWQKKFLEGPEVAKQLAYWKERLRGMVELDLPTDHPRPPVKSWKGDIVSLLLPREMTARLQAIATRNGATLFHLFVAAFKVLLSRYTGSTDVAVGTPIAGRTRAEIEPLIGVFINSLILRSDLSGDPPFEEFLRQVRDTAFAAVENQDLPFECLVRELRPNRDQSRNPLFQVNFTHQRSFAKAGQFGGLTFTPIPSRSPGAIFDLHFFMVEREEGWRASCDFSTDLFERSTALRMLGHFRRALEDIADEPAKPVSKLEILTGEEKALLLGEWAGRRTEYPREATVGELFTDLARRDPGRVALVRGDATVTYGQLHAAAAKLARHLIAAGARPGARIALCANPSPETIVGILGILMAGGAYVPLDPAYPAERFALLLEDCGATVAVSDPAFAERFAGWPGQLVLLEPAGQSAEPVEPPSVAITAADPAYVLFTSGSTGRPKGVVVPHRAVVRLVRGCDYVAITPDDVFLQAAPLSFDASTLEIWGPLLNGGRLVIPPYGAGLAEIAEAVRRHGVTILWLTAGLFQVMVEEHLSDLQGLKQLLAGGDVLSVPHVRRAMLGLPGTRLINGYGPTENTTFTTCHAIASQDLDGPSIPIGRPIANTSVYLLDDRGRPVPVGVPGELLTGGDGLAIGYQGNAELTAATFVPNPLPGHAGERLYRTGDVCRWRPDGAIEFIGRRDHQVKVRGFRIELGEIEAVLSAHPDVRQAKVGVRGGGAEGKRVVAWVAPKEGRRLDGAALSVYLSERLPAFMRPDAVAVLEALPVSAHGKVDTSALPDPSVPARPADGQGESPSRAPVGAIEQRLAAIWGELLGVGTVGRDDDFFALGGHSLMALRLFSRIHREFHRSLPLAMLLKHPTVRGLAALLGDQPAVAEPSEQECTGVIVTLTEGGTGAPLFCIHGGDGAVLFYRSLATLMEPDCAIHAIESLHLCRSAAIAKCSVEQTAAAYVRNLRKLQPRGPYRLAGYSFGGVVAHAMGCLLAAEGERVEFLGLFDTHNPAVSPRQYSAAERLAVFWKQHEALGFVPRIGMLIRRINESLQARKRTRAEEAAARAQGSAPAEANSDLRRVQVYEAHKLAMRAYRPKPFPGRMTLFKAKMASDKLDWPEDYGWGPPACGELDIIPVPGRHLSLFEPGHVEELAVALGQCLSRLNRPPSEGST